ncbi:response regulator transcription factor [Arthrobacter sp. MPF02]|uniref:response regulator transcription factor n=1 Tax=Arthrobacter sp. MPF02 TaxID=3388492 RepID=UPI003984FD87
MDTLSAVVIEDDPDVNLLISTVLQRAGFTVHAAVSGPEGVQAASRVQASLITTDMDLPGFDGLEVIRRIRMFSTAPIMIISATKEAGDIELGLFAGADQYLLKPFRPGVLEAHAKALLRRPAIVPEARN